jgi:Ca2+-binding RTX toxin-like protein
MPRLFLVVLIVLVVLSVVSAFAATNVVPVTYLSNQALPVNANTIKPAECSGITLTTVVYCSAGVNCNGTNADELIIGSPAADIIQGKGGNDCILGGGGDDDITGSQAKDVCIGGDGLNDIFTKCETVIQ